MRAYLMFIGPWEQGGEWNDNGISGISRWLNRVWNLVLEEYNYSEGVGSPAGEEEPRELARITHQTIKKITNDLEKMRFNTMIAALMEFTNYLTKTREAGHVTDSVWKETLDTLLLLLAPTTPHLAEELWQRTAHEYSIHNQNWPKWDETLAKEEEVTLVVQVNGKLRDRITVPASITEAEARQLAAESTRVKSYLEGKTTVKEIYVPGKLVNMVVR